LRGKKKEVYGEKTRNFQNEATETTSCGECLSTERGTHKTRTAKRYRKHGKKRADGTTVGKTRVRRQERGGNVKNHRKMKRRNRRAFKIRINPIECQGANSMGVG